MSDTPDFSDIPGIERLEKAFKLMGVNVNLTNQEIKDSTAPTAPSAVQALQPQVPQAPEAKSLNSIPSSNLGIEGDIKFQQPFRISWKSLGGFSAGAIRRGDGSIRPHHGMDLQAPAGTSIYPIAAGVVDSIAFEEGENISSEGVKTKNNNTMGGTTVWVKHANGLKSYYAHMKDISVNPGQKVTLETVLGTCGNTGNAKHTSSHLHLGVQLGGQWVDPAPYIGNSAGAVPTAPKVAWSAAERIVALGQAFVKKL